MNELVLTQLCRAVVSYVGVCVDPVSVLVYIRSCSGFSSRSVLRDRALVRNKIA